ncbi:MAG TPA: hypothetical protein DGF10_02550, partial [Acidimicrobiaceae bacterium]|nr:hypothetical protein [Acidimicrobiaceae bacterium]
MAGSRSAIKTVKRPTRDTAFSVAINSLIRNLSALAETHTVANSTTAVDNQIQSTTPTDYALINMVPDSAMMQLWEMQYPSSSPTVVGAPTL